MSFLLCVEFIRHSPSVVSLLSSERWPVPKVLSHLLPWNYFSQYELHVPVKMEFWVGGLFHVYTIKIAVVLSDMRVLKQSKIRFWCKLYPLIYKVSPVVHCVETSTEELLYSNHILRLSHLCESSDTFIIALSHFLSFLLFRNFPLIYYIHCLL